MTDLLIRIKCNGVECGECYQRDWVTCFMFVDEKGEFVQLEGEVPLRCPQCLEAEDVAISAIDDAVENSALEE